LGVVEGMGKGIREGVKKGQERVLPRIKTNKIRFYINKGYFTNK
jgi:hypothetical protein